MVVIRYLAHAALMSTLVAGCNQSLFDANPPDGEGDRDGGDRPDARVGDGGNVDGPDAGSPDASVQPSCPMPCLGDAVLEFSMNQEGPWRYTETLLDADGLPQFRDMIYATWIELNTWLGEAVPPAIANCGENTTSPKCAGLPQKLLLAPTNDVPGARQPALLWTVPKTGSFRLTADWRIADETPTGVPTSVLVARNSLRDDLYTTSFLSSISPGAFDFEVDAAEGDTLALTVIPGADPGVPLGMSFYVTDLERNDACQLTYYFENEAGPFDDRCENGNVFNEEGGAPTQSAAPPPGVPGRARTFSDGSSLLHQSPPIDYNGDWTLQFWAAFTGSGDVLSDRSCMDLGRPVSGGIDITFDGESVFVRIGEEVSGTDHCLAGPAAAFSPSVDFESAADWHFYRVVRNKAAGTVTACVDGTYRSSHVLQVPETATMFTDRSLEVGRPADLSNGSFEGSLADLRMYRRALPCTLRPEP